MRHHLLEGFAKKLTKEDVVLVEAKGDRRGEDLKVIERDLARSALADESVKP